jgi:thiamine-phosphate pyrophosphorylase
VIYLLLYYITDRLQFPGDEAARRSRLLEKIAEAIRCGVDYIQLREKDLSARQLEVLAREVMTIVQDLRTGNNQLRTGLLMNSRTDIAIACRAHGVHLRSDDISLAEVREIWAKCEASATSASSGQALSRPTVGVSCHTPGEVADAAAKDADFVVFGPIFEKARSRPTGLEPLRKACQQKIPVLALGGISVENAEACIQAGAAGIAAIRLFQENDVDKVIAALRRHKSVAPNTADD